MTLTLVETRARPTCYLEETDPMLAMRIAMVWARDPAQPNSGGTRITPTSYLLGLCDAFGSCGNVEAAYECSFLLELYHRKIMMEAQR